MTQVMVAEAQRGSPDLLCAVEAGEEVQIRAEDGRTFTLAVQPPVPVINPDWPGYPHPGSAKGLLEVTDVFDEPLEDMKEYME